MVALRTRAAGALTRPPTILILTGMQGDPVGSGEGAEATLGLPGTDSPDLTAMLAKAAAGKAALTAAKHCQQVLGGIGFTAEHDLQHHVKRVLVLDGLLGSSKELTRKAGAGLRARGSAPRLAQL